LSNHGPRLFCEINTNLTGVHMKKSEGSRLTIIMPPELKDYLLRQAELNWSSMNSEAIRLIRAAAEAEQKADA